GRRLISGLFVLCMSSLFPQYILLYFSEYKAYTVNMSLQFSLQKKPQRLLKLFCLVAGTRLELMTFGLCDRRATTAPPGNIFSKVLNYRRNTTFNLIYLSLDKLERSLNFLAWT